ncbi:MAG: hypothetical protein GF346_04650 [Candidatus Eisenbacteria bacterium]|nr:hypothetical protein [Candidatus Latescibacterota bacterium]MBD3301715.1 hypothetical protein [Candidatus Eisenbacteria bacterium]
MTRNATTAGARRGRPLSGTPMGGIALALLVLCLAAPSLSAEPGPDRLKTLGLSLLVPGLGHLSAGYDGRAQGFMAAEAVIWGAFAVFEVQGELRKDSYIEMAELFGGVPDADGLSDDYYRLIGQYPSAEIYNDEIRRDARARHGDDLDAREAYFEQNRIADDRTWSWVSSAARQSYRSKRSDSNRSFKRAGYMVGVAVANRLLAAVDAMRLIHKGNESSAMRVSIRPDFPEFREPAQLCVTVRFP